MGRVLGRAHPIDPVIAGSRIVPFVAPRQAGDPPRAVPRFPARRNKEGSRCRAPARRSATGPRPGLRARTGSDLPSIADCKSRAYGGTSSAACRLAISSTGSRSSFSPHLADHRPDRDDLLGIESNADIIMRMVERLVGDVALGGRVEADHDLGGRLGQALAGSNQERHISPAPRVDQQPDRGEGLDLRIGGDPFFLAVAHDTGRGRRCLARAGGSPAIP